MRKPLFTSEAGVTHEWEDDGAGGGIIHSTADVAPILELNKAMATENDGYAPSRELRRVASIPLVLIAKWLSEEGWDAFDPANEDKLAAKLNSADYAHLRTAPGRLGVSQGQMR